jgi:hypothetical protein
MCVCDAFHIGSIPCYVFIFDLAMPFTLPAY